MIEKRIRTEEERRCESQTTNSDQLSSDLVKVRSEGYVRESYTLFSVELRRLKAIPMTKLKDGLRDLVKRLRQPL